MSFEGHVLPGCVFLFLSSWWASQIFRRYFLSQRKSSPPYMNTATFKCQCGRLPNWEVEGIVKVVFTLICIAAELAVGFEKGTFHMYMESRHHSTMYFLMGVSGAVDIIVHHRSMYVPKGIEYVTLSLAFGVEALLFMFHVKGHAPLSMTVHNLLVLAIMGCTIFTALELMYRDNVLFALGRAYSMLLQGTWFWQVSFILYAPVVGAEEWDVHDDDSVRLATLIFAWHLTVDFVILLAMGAVIGRIYRKEAQQGEYNPLPMDHIKENGNFIVSMTNDSDMESMEPLTKTQDI